MRALPRTRPVAVYLWRKLDERGLDACRLFRIAGGWRLNGAAIFATRSGACHLQYDVDADAARYSRTLQVLRGGAVSRYPGLFERVATRPQRHDDDRLG